MGRGGKGRRRREPIEATVFQNLISELTSYHCYHKLLITQISPGAGWRGLHENVNPRSSITWGHLGDWVAQIIWLQWMPSPVILGVLAYRLAFPDIHVASLRPLIFTWSSLASGQVFQKARHFLASFYFGSGGFPFGFPPFVSSFVFVSRGTVEVPYFSLYSLGNLGHF